ncbi:MAG: DUF1573 domain-containing protein [Chloroflexota bacterium]
MRLLRRLLIILAFAVIGLSGDAVAQPLHGVINKFLPVATVDDCGVTLRFFNPRFDLVGEKALLIQLRGALIDTTNTPTFGSILSYGNCGNFEVVTIESVDDLHVKFRNKIINQYSPEAGSVQLVTIPQYSNAVIDSLAGTHNFSVERIDFGGPLFYSTGGIIALEVKGTLSFQGDIHGEGIGFTSSLLGGDSALECTDANWRGIDTPATSAGKGMGIAELIRLDRYGRGRRANGGGGGNQARSGGGGGGNGGAGGRGGNELVSCGSHPVGGEGGSALSYNFDPLRVFLAGAGGDGQRSHPLYGMSASGGGIIIIIADRIEGNGHSIIANGNFSLWDGKGYGDGGGGGGAGGTVLICCNDIASPLTIDVRGGTGEDDYEEWDSVNSRLCMGPGGGGGGGVVGFSGPAVPANVTILKSGGTPGIVRYGADECRNTNYGAEPGEEGIILTGINIPESDIPIAALEFSKSELDFGEIRCGEELTLPLAVTNQSNYDVVVKNIDNLTEHFSCEMSTLKIKAHNSSIIDVKFHPKKIGNITDTLRLFYPNSCVPYLVVVLKGTNNGVRIGVDSLVDLGGVCDDEPKSGSLLVTNLSAFPTNLQAAIGPPGLFSFPNNAFSATFASGEARNIEIRYKGGAGIGKHIGQITITDSCGKETVINIALTVSKLIINKKKDATICKPGYPLQLSSEFFDVSGGAGALKFDWQPKSYLTDGSSLYPRIIDPHDLAYKLTVTDSLGCTATMDLNVKLVDGTKLEFSPKSVDFGEISLCEANKETTIDIINTGSTDAELIPAFDRPEFSTMESIPIAVPKGEKRTIKLRYTRTSDASGDIQGKLILTEKNCGEFEIDILGKAAPFSIIYTDSVDFGVLGFCEDSLISFIHIRNNSSTDTLRLGIAKFAVSPTPFRCLLIENAQERSYGPGEAVTSLASFLSAPAGVYSNVILIPYEIDDCADTLRIPVNGRIDESFDVAYTQNIIFPKIIDCETYSEAYIYIKNTGQAKIDSVWAADASMLEFEDKAELNKGLAAGDSLAIKVKFKPATEGIVTGKIYITIYVGDCEKTLGIPFEGEKEGFAYSATSAIDFGDIPDCELGKPIEREFTLRANASTPALIKNIDTGGDFAPGKNFETDLKVGNLPANVDNIFKCRFTPDATGIYSGYIDVEMEPCDTKFRIALTARVLLTGLTEIQGELNFGEIAPNAQARLVAKYVNSGEANLSVNEIIAPNAPFSILSTIPPLPCVLNPGDTLSVEIEFASKVSGKFLDSVRFVAQPCDISKKLPLKGGVSLDVPSNVEIVVGDASGKTGEIISVPISLRVGQFASGEKYRYRATLKFNKTLLSPKFELLKDSLGERDRYCTFEGETPLRDTAFAGLSFVAALGDSRSTPLSLAAFEWLDAKDMPAIKKDGVFTLTDICDEGGERLFEASEQGGALLVSPNPTTGEAEISFIAIESGATELSLYDIQGKRAAVLYKGNPKAKKITLKADLSNLQPGVYYLKLKTPTQNYSSKLVIGR